jgi:hypothetical protein
MLVLKQMNNNTKQGQLRCVFPKLTEANQQYMLGIAEGLKFAQNELKKVPDKRLPLTQDNNLQKQNDIPI